MGVLKATDEVANALSANLAAKITEVGTAAGKTLDSAFTLFKRQRAETFWRKKKAGVGIWVRSAQTRALNQTRRDWKIRMMIDYTFRGQDRDAVAEQVELTVDAIMRVIDGLPDGVSTVTAASEEQFGTTTVTDLDELIQEAAGDITEEGPIVAGARIEVPLIQRENV